MRNPNGPSIEEKEAMQEHLEDLNEQWRNELCGRCGLARKIVVHSDAALDEFHHFERRGLVPDGEKGRQDGD